MSISAKDLTQSPYIRLLVMGSPKIGKTSCLVATSPKPVHVLLCEDDSALVYASRITGGDFTFDRTRQWGEMQTAVLEVSRKVKKGEIKTVILDPLSTFAEKLEQQCLDATDTGKGPDGRRAYPAFNRRISQLCSQLFAMKAHIIVVTHYVDVGGGEVQPDNGGEATPRSGEGFMPLLPGKARALVPAKFPDVVWMDYVKGRRVLVTGPRGAWGPGCRSLKETRVLSADVHDKTKKRVGIAAFIRARKKAAEEDSARQKDE